MRSRSSDGHCVFFEVAGCAWRLTAHSPPLKGLPRTFQSCCARPASNGAVEKPEFALKSAAKRLIYMASNILRSIVNTPIRVPDRVLRIAIFRQAVAELTQSSNYREPLAS